MPLSPLFRAGRTPVARPTFVLAFISALAFWALLGPRLFTADAAGLDGTGQVYGHDFAQFWAAGRMALDGDVAAIWQPERFTATLRQHFPGKDVADGMRFHYPPPALLPFAAFASLPVTFAFPLMTFGGMALLLVALWRIVPGWRVSVCVLGTPTLLNVILYGQWSLWLAALLTIALVPVMRGNAPRGFAASFFVMKPTLGLALPLGFLFAPKGWRKILHCMAFAIALLACSTALFGIGAWRAWFAALPESSTALLDQLNVWRNHSVTFSTALHSLGVPPAPARIAQLAFTVAVFIVAGLALHGGARNPLKAALLATATVLAAPYGMVYDLALLFPAAFFFIRDAQAHGFRVGDRLLLATGAVLPFAAADLQAATGVPIAFLFTLVAFVWIARRAFASAAKYESGTERDEQKPDRVIPAKRLPQHEH